MILMTIPFEYSGCLECVRGLGFVIAEAPLGCNGELIRDMQAWEPALELFQWW